MIIEITRARVIKALKTEPTKNLRPNAWVEPGVYGTLKANPDCEVCAVGAVMRSVLDPRRGAAEIGHAASYSVAGFPWVVLEGTRKEIVASAAGYAKTRPMAALSSVFEGLSYLKAGQRFPAGLTNRDIAGIRRSVISFAKKYLPSKMRIDIGRSKPAKDVPVVGGSL